MTEKEDFSEKGEDIDIGSVFLEGRGTKLLRNEESVDGDAEWLPPSLTPGTYIPPPEWRTSRQMDAEQALDQICNRKQAITFSGGMQAVPSKARKGSNELPPFLLLPLKSQRDTVS